MFKKQFCLYMEIHHLTQSEMMQFSGAQNVKEFLDFYIYFEKCSKNKYFFVIVNLYAGSEKRRRKNCKFMLKFTVGSEI
jgi:hypothetical protein